MRARSGARPATGPVVVGVDGSLHALAAAQFGAWEAKRRRAALVLVHGFADHVSYAHGRWPNRTVTRATRDDARELLAEVEARVHTEQPGVPIRTSLVASGGASSVVELSKGSSLVLVGARGRGGFEDLKLGSVASQVAMHSHAPVIVVRRPPRRAGAPAEDVTLPPAVAAGPVVVGIDCSPGSNEALAFAVEEAAARGAALVPLYAWHRRPSKSLEPRPVFDFDLAGAREEAARMLAEATAGWTEHYPDVPVHPVVQYDTDPAWALAEASRKAGLIVIGSRGHGGFPRLRLGSTSKAVLNQAHGSVAVVRARGF